MTSEDLRVHMRRQPFEPFRIIMSDGSAHEIPHPEYLLVGRTRATTQIEHDTYDEVIDLSIRHILRVERSQQLSSDSA